jgi:CheY-like chemotaxis protein
MSQALVLESLLVVDPHPEDVIRLQEATEAANIASPLSHVLNGNDLLPYLDGAHPYSDRTSYPRPQVALLEWDLPGMNALALLQKVRDHPKYFMLPIMIWTRAEVSDAELKQAYHLGLSGFFTKPQSGDISSVVALVLEYWKLAEKPLAGTR